MSQPSVDTNEQDGALGVLPPSSGKIYALLGVAASGPINTPATYAKVKDLVATLTAGPLLEAAAHEIERYGKPVVVVRTGQSVDGSYLDEVDAQDGTVSSLTRVNPGSATQSVHASPTPDAAHVIQILFVIGATVGVTGGVYQVFVDGVWLPAEALGTATSITIHGVQIDLGSGTLNAGQTISFTTTAPIPESAGELVVTGTVIPTIDGSTHPNDDYEVFVKFINGGTRGIAGITYQWSLDGGRTMSPTTALGTATSIIIPGSGGVKVDLAAGAIGAGDTFAFPTVAPQWNNTEIGTALDALKASAVAWDIAHVVGPIAPDAFDVVDLKISGMPAVGKFRAWVGNTRIPVGGETEADYLASLSSAFGSKATTYGEFCAGACDLTSSVSGRKYRRPICFAVGAREASVSEEIDTADINLGTLVGVSIRDEAGNPKHHDESANPGLDDARFTVLRTVDGYAGVYINRPRVFSPDGSDFQLMPHRRVMNLARATVRAFLIRRCSVPVLVDKNTGFLLEEEALEIEKGLQTELGGELLVKPKASGTQVAVSRTDNLLSTKKITGSVRIIPLAYPEFFEFDIGFLNPALQVQAV